MAFPWSQFLVLAAMGLGGILAGWLIAARVVFATCTVRSEARARHVEARVGLAPAQPGDDLPSLVRRAQSAMARLGAEALPVERSFPAATA